MSKDREQALRAEVRLEAGKTAFRRKTKRGKRGKRGLQKAKITTQGENQAGIRVFSAACVNIPRQSRGLYDVSRSKRLERGR